MNVLIPFIGLVAGHIERALVSVSSAPKPRLTLRTSDGEFAMLIHHDHGQMEIDIPYGVDPSFSKTVKELLDMTDRIDMNDFEEDVCKKIATTILWVSTTSKVCTSFQVMLDSRDEGVILTGMPDDYDVSLNVCLGNGPDKVTVIGDEEKCEQFKTDLWSLLNARRTSKYEKVGNHMREHWEITTDIKDILEGGADDEQN